VISAITPLLVALLPLVVAVLAQLALSSSLQLSVWFLLYPAVFLSSWIGGLRAAVIASLVAVAFALWIAPSTVQSSASYVASTVFVATGVLFGVFHDRLRRANRDRRMFAALIENSSDFIGIANPNGKPMYLNPAGRRMVGLDRSIEDTEISDYYPEDQREFAKDVILKSMVEHGHWQGETAFRHWQTGAAIPVSDTHFMVCDPDTGEVLGMATITRDISDLQKARDDAERARREVRASLDDLSRAQSVAKVGSWRFTAGRNEAQCSDETYRIFGMPVGSPRMTYEAFIASVHPEDRAFVDRHWNAALRGQSYDIEHRIVIGDTIKWVRETADLELDEHGNLARCIGVTHDITERKRAEQERRVAEATAQGILSIAADAIITIDEEQRITLFNEGAETIFGYTAAEAIGAPLDLLLPERLRAVHRHHVGAFAADPTTTRRMGTPTMEVIGRRKTGEEFPADATISRLEIAGTRILTVALRDITEQKRFETEQTLLVELGSALVSTLELETILASIGHVVTRRFADACIVYLVGERGEVRRLDVTIRDPAKQWLREALLERPIERSQQAEIWVELHANRSVLVDRVTPEMVATWARGEDELRMLRALDVRSYIMTPCFAHGRLVGAIGLISSTPGFLYTAADVRFAEQVAQRAALTVDNAQLYAQARRALQSRDDVLGIVAHDLRNPLGAVLMQAELLQLDEAAHRSHKAAASIERSAMRMRRLIEDLLDVSRLEQGQLSIRRARVSANQTISEAVSAHQARADAASLQLDVAAERELPAVWADRDRLLQILENLIGNAIKFTDAGGIITVGAALRGGEVVFWVADTGTGIAAEALPHVFDPFWQAQKGRRSGAGLGLPIAKGLVEAHGGRIWVDSTRGRGTTFHFTIPTAQDGQHT
jgi:PAS domain S-box-containing protein